MDDDMTSISDHDGGAPPGVPSTLPNAPPKRQACVPCREAKLRCSARETGWRTGEICVRCSRLQLNCQYYRKKRAKKEPSIRGVGASNQSRVAKDTDLISGDVHTTMPEAFDQQQTDAFAALLEASTSEDYAPRMPTAGPSTFSNAPNIPTSNTRTATLADLEIFASAIGTFGAPSGDEITEPSSYQRTGFPAMSMDADNGTPSSANHPTGKTSSTAATAGGGAAGSASLDMTEYLDPELHRAGTGGMEGGEGSRKTPQEKVPGQRTTYQDPVTLGYLSHLEADRLVTMFNHRLNPMIALLDPHLHTTSYLRSRSAILFSCVLCASSKFFQPEVYDSLHSHAQMITNREVTTGAAEVELIQSVLILIYWKRPTDKSIWIKLGMAVSMANQMRLYSRVDSGRKLPDNILEAREVVDVERTWFCLKCFDRSYSEMFGLPNLIRSSDMGDAELWARGHEHLQCPEDMHLAFSLQMLLVDEIWTALRNGPSTPSVLRGLEDLEARRQAAKMKWFVKQSHLIDSSADLLRVFFARGTFGVRRTRFEMTSSPLLRSECLVLAGELVDAIQVLADLGSLRHLQDIAAVTLSEIGLFINTIFSDLESSERRTAVLLMRKVHRMCVRDTDQESAPAFIARFFARLLRSLDIQSRMQSRAASPALGQSGGSLEVDPFADQATDLLMQNLLSSGTVIFSGMDDSYWNTLLSQMPVIEDASRDQARMWSSAMDPLG